ncbi:MAG: hypothetical protein ACC645_10570 [Pirellulales bacterium]
MHVSGASQGTRSASVGFRLSILRQQPSIECGSNLRNSSSERASRQMPARVGIVLASEYPLPRSYGDELADSVREKMHNPDLHVRVACVAAGWPEPGDNENE